MRFQNPILDRIWLTLIAIAFLFMVPLWLSMQIEQFGWRLVLVGLWLAFLFYRWRK